MSANIKVSGEVYNGIDTISVKDETNALVDFVLDGATPPAITVEESDVNFYDYDGTLVASYTAADFANLSALPANPSRTGLVAEGWNWTLADAKTYVASYGKLNIGQMYHTASGKTEYDIDVNEASGFTATLTGTSGVSKDWGDGTTDTLETHTYATAGNYTIKLSGTTLPSVQGSKKLRAVRIASGVTGIDDNVFYQCYALEYVSIPRGVTTMGRAVFQNAYLMAFISFPNGLVTVGGNLLDSCVCLKTASLPISITPNSVSVQHCETLKRLTIPPYIETISLAAFGYCRSIQEIKLPNGVTAVGTQAFRDCLNLKEIELPSSITSIGTAAFANCSWLTIVTVLATTPPTVASNSFPSNVTKIYVPHGTLATYKADTNWSTYSSKLVELPA